jgi:hypothetical protein
MSNEILASYAKMNQLAMEAAAKRESNAKPSTNGLLTRSNSNGKIDSGVDYTQPAYRLSRYFTAIKQQREKLNGKA